MDNWIPAFAGMTEEKIMKCPIDQTEMEIGYLLSNKGAVPYWAPKSSLNASIMSFLNFTWGHSKVWAWKCPKCGKVELKIEEKDDK